MIEGICILRQNEDKSWSWEFEPPDTEVIPISREALETLLREAYG